MKARIIVPLLFTAGLLVSGCGGEATTCDDLDCSTQGRICEQQDDTAWCGDCVSGYVEAGGVCGPRICEVRDDCPDDEIGDWSSCSYESECSESGERTRQVVYFSCGLDDRCSARSETEVDTEGCQRETEGDDCLNGSCTAGVCQLHTGPDVTTLEPTRVTSDQARLGGQLVSTGGRQVTGLQLCYGTAPDDLQTCIDFDDVDEGDAFDVDVDGLSSNPPYYVEARVTNDVDTTIGEQRMFMTVDRCEGNYVVTDDFGNFVDDYAAAVCPGESADCDDACPDDQCVDFTPYPASGCGHITGHLFVVWNDEMETLPSFDGLTAIDESLRIHDNPSLVTADTFDDLFRIGGPLMFDDNYAIETFDGFSALTEIGGSLAMEGSLWPEDSAGLASIGAFQQLQTIGGHLQLRKVHGLVSLSNFQQLHTIEGRLQLDGLEQLESLQGVDGVTELGGLSLMSNHALVDLKGLEQIRSLDGEFFVWLNNGLETLDGIEELTTVGGSFYLWSNRALTSIAALAQLQSVGGETFYVSGNDLLAQCDAEALRQQVEFNGEMSEISDNNEEAVCE